jgi:hypothetical protein
MTDEFNKMRKKVVSASREKTTDESMCAMRPRTTKLGGWPHISYILHKHDPLGKEFKNTCCSITGVHDIHDRSLDVISEGELRISLEHDSHNAGVDQSKNSRRYIDFVLVQVLAIGR